MKQAVAALADQVRGWFENPTVMIRNNGKLTDAILNGFTDEEAALMLSPRLRASSTDQKSKKALNRRAAGYVCKCVSVCISVWQCVSVCVSV